MTEPINDVESRHAILNDLQSSIMVEAAAGTGKTTSIVGRMVNLIATDSCKIENLVAVTFTRKAAAELRERFQSKLREELKAKRTADEIQRLQIAANRIEYAFVGTFHSFCSALLRERPIEANVDPGFREIEEAEQTELREEAWRSTLAEMYATQDPLLAQMFELGLETKDLRDCFQSFVDFSDVEQWPHDLPDPIDIDQLRKQLVEYVAEMRQLSVCFPEDRGTDELMNRYEDIVRKFDNSDIRVTAELFDLLESFESKSKITQKNWHDKKISKEEFARYTSFREGMVQSALAWWRQFRYKFVVEFLTRARQKYDQLRDASGGLDFQDLLLKAATALKSQPKLRAYFQRRFTHLLVDEFQDTDPIQAEVIAFLTSTDHSETTWQKCILKPGSLFLVGDPKQSIYRFRRADIVTYQQVKALFDQSGGRLLPLTRNFRSVEPLIQWNNSVFEELLGSHDTKYSPAAETMDPERPASRGKKLQGIFNLEIPAELSASEAKLFEADAVARFIRDAIDSQATLARTPADRKRGIPPHAQPGDFLIVTWAKRSLHAFAAALDRYQIPNEVTGSNVFQQIQPLQILIDCLRAIDDPKNPIPYVALLRGKLFGFSDAELYELKRLGGHFSYTSLVPDTLPARLQQRFASVSQRFASYLVWMRSLPYPAAVSKIAGDLGLLAATTLEPEGNALAGGFLKAIEALRVHSWDFDSATDMITFLTRLVEQSEASGCSALAQSGSVVRIMNLHKVKGLEAPVVFLAAPFGKFKQSCSSHVDRSGETARGYMWITKKVGYQPRAIASPSDWEKFEQEERLFLEAEETRLLYVGCTRAANQLIVSRQLGKEQNSRWQNLYQFLDESPKVAIPETIAESPGASPSTDLTELIKLQTRLPARWQAASQPSYQMVTAKKFALQGTSRPDWHATGEYGYQWGSAIHELLEAHWKQPGADKARLALQLALEYQLGAHRVEELLATLTCVINSKIWQRAQLAKRIFSEIPFESPVVDQPIPTFARGVIDLVFEEEAGWTIVDYKTDDIEPVHLASATAFYAPQIDDYATYWENITGEQVMETGLLFTKINTYQITQR
jgi:ATP-dependent helicase/nuclease subunit A